MPRRTKTAAAAGALADTLVLVDRSRSMESAETEVQRALRWARQASSTFNSIPRAEAARSNVDNVTACSVQCYRFGNLGDLLRAQV